MSSKKLITQTVKLSLFDNCKDVFDEQTKPFFVQMLTNGNIRDELSKIIEKNSQLFGKNVVNNSQMVDTSIIDEMNESTSELKVEEQASPSKIAIMEEGEKESSFHNNIQNNNFNPSIEISEYSDNPLLKMKQSVFSDLNVEDPNRIISSQMLTKSKFNLTSSLPKNRNKRINENANAGSLPRNTTSPSVWITVKNWLNKAIKKIGKMTNDFLHFLSTHRKSLLVDFGILILGIALLFTAGVIQDPTKYFQAIFKKLISFLF